MKEEERRRHHDTSHEPNDVRQADTSVSILLRDHHQCSEEACCDRHQASEDAAEVKGQKRKQRDCTGHDQNRCGKAYPLIELSKHERAPVSKGRSQYEVLFYTTLNVRNVNILFLSSGKHCLFVLGSYIEGQGRKGAHQQNNGGEFGIPRDLGPLEFPHIRLLRRLVPGDVPIP